MRHWITMLEWDAGELNTLVARAAELKAGSTTQALRGRILGMLFFNPSLRTRVSMEAAIMRYGGHAITLSPGADSWRIEYAEGVRMDGDKAEHVREAAPVLSRYCDVLGIRSFAGMKEYSEDRKETVIRSFARFATVPVVNLESAIEHPCQALGDMLTMKERLGATEGRRFVLTWAPHVNPLPLAVPHSAVLAAALAGMQVTVAHPEGYELDDEISGRAGSIQVTHEQSAALQAADIVYVKSWGARAMYGDIERQRDSFLRHRDWTVSRTKLPPESYLMHCLPVRRNLVIADDALDSDRSIVIDQAENRMWAQAAILEHLLQQGRD